MIGVKAGREITQGPSRDVIIFNYRLHKLPSAERKELNDDLTQAIYLMRKVYKYVTAVARASRHDDEQDTMDDHFPDHRSAVIKACEDQLPDIRFTLSLVGDILNKHRKIVPRLHEDYISMKNRLSGEFKDIMVREVSLICNL